MEDQFDALMYYGPDSSITYSELLPMTCSDQYINMRIKRMILADFPKTEIDNKINYYQKLKDKLSSE